MKVWKLDHNQTLAIKKWKKKIKKLFWNKHERTTKWVAHLFIFVSAIKKYKLPLEKS